MTQHTIVTSPATSTLVRLGSTEVRVLSVVPEEDKKGAGITAAVFRLVTTKTKLIDGWRIRNGLDWTIAMVSFILFVLLETAIIYSYVVFLKQLGY